MSRAQQVVLTLICAVLVVGTIASGVLRLYASRRHRFRRRASET